MGRSYNGKEYYHFGTTYHTKREAKREANQRRREGYLVRVVKIKGGYLLYQRIR